MNDAYVVELVKTTIKYTLIAGVLMVPLTFLPIYKGTDEALKSLITAIGIVVMTLLVLYAIGLNVLGIVYFIYHI